MRTIIVAVLLASFATLALGEPPSRPFASIDSAKRVARDAIYSEHHIDFYCGCAFTPTKTKSGGTINATACGYTPRKNKARGRVLEWEHVVPAAFFGQHRTCWRKGHDECVNSKGVALKGRECCARVDDFERLRDARISAAQGNRNPFVK